MSQKLGLSDLPTELLLDVAGFLSIRDLSSFSCLNRQCHWRLFHLLFESAIAERSDSRRPEQCLVNLFFHAVRHDSTNIAQYLIYSTNRINLNGYEIFYTISIYLSLWLMYLDRSGAPPYATPSSTSSAMPPAKAPAFLRTSPSFILPCWLTHREFQQI